jgi:PHP family Zn ribbon phosphoesterase
LPLHEIISLAIKVGINSKATWSIYNSLIKVFGDEYNILFFVSREDLNRVLSNSLLVDLIILNRDGKIEIKPGYDGVYGKALIGGKEISLDEEKASSLDKSNESSRDAVNIIKKPGELQKKLF